MDEILGRAGRPVSGSVNAGQRAQFRVHCAPAFKERAQAWAAAQGLDLSGAVVAAVAAAMKDGPPAAAGEVREQPVVCAACGTEACWQGILMCDEAWTAGIAVAVRKDGR
jgi:hypothetical protein